jgi:protein-tyrosine phosphatase
MESNKSKANMMSLKELNLYDLKNTKSKICCHGKPKIKEIKHLKTVYGINHFLTLLDTKEKPEAIEAECLKQDLGWYHVKMGAATIEYLEEAEVIELVIAHLLELYKLLKDNEIVLYIHCAAGFHRTGTFVYSLLRLFEESPDSAMNALKFIRKDTYDNVGDERIQYVEDKILPIVLPKI